MKKGLRNSMIGAVCLSMVGCANMDSEDFASSAGMLVALIGITAVVLLSDNDNDSDSDDNRYHYSDKSRDNKNAHHGYHKCRDGRSCYRPK
ncbi:hypothetical protein [Limnobaculum parvum]|uniref:Lipoprotein n=1 Tax=Limnobaculum parvum TaxID=2172103 RepID=A0A2Y9TUW1_9GAMM|nr:hypothetical protein [Limnobaculum parvum]AWH87330.1 hypothetical protein HYN51_01385 [Limnobaculum parvum]